MALDVDLPLFDDPETGERYVVYPDGRWLAVDFDRLHEKVASGAYAGRPTELAVARYLCGEADD